MSYEGELRSSYDAARKRLFGPVPEIYKPTPKPPPPAVLETSNRLFTDAVKDADNAGEVQEIPAFLRARVAEERLTIKRIIDVVSNISGVSVADIKSYRKNTKVVRPRHVAMYMAKELTDYSYPQIAAKFSGRDHSTIIHAVTKIQRHIETDPDLADLVNRARDVLTAGDAVQSRIAAAEQR